MRLILVRHGRPDWQHYFFTSLSQHEYLVVCYDAAQLSKEGAEAIGDLTQQLPRAMILSSDLPRARETAEILGTQNGMIIHFDSLFREVKAPYIAIGSLGKLWGPSILWILLRSGCWFAGIGDYPESPYQAWVRAGNAVRKILKYFETEKTIILVSHGWFITLIAFYLRRHRLIDQGPLVPNVGFGSVTECFLRARKHFD